MLSNVLLDKIKLTTVPARKRGLGLCCLTPTLQLYRGGHCYWWRKPECPEEKTDM